jgi:hypothetical protein
MKNTNIKIQYLLAGSLLLGMTNSFALDDSDLQYNSIGLGFSSQSVGGYTQKISSTGLSGSYLINDSIYIGGGVNNATFSPPGVTQVKYNGADIGIGYRYGISRTTDLTTSVDYSSTNITEAGYNGVTQNGTFVNFGIRSLVMPNVELGGGLSFGNYQNQTTNSNVALTSGTATQLSAGVRLFISKEFAVKGAYGYSSSNSSNGKTYTSNSVALSVAYYFQSLLSG